MDAIAFRDQHPGAVGLFLEPELSDVFRVSESLSREWSVWVYFGAMAIVRVATGIFWPKARDVAFEDISK
ncbi:hypothetical protein [Paraburkholderia fungorum]|uniref:hypothetical protein n=1 Tax=Paraburkholderia fungorum TaxID=134537 RepID=UPI0038BCA451